MSKECSGTATVRQAMRTAGLIIRLGEIPGVRPLLDVPRIHQRTVDFLLDIRHARGVRRYELAQEYLDGAKHDFGFLAVFVGIATVTGSMPHMLIDPRNLMNPGILILILIVYAFIRR